MRNKYYLSMLVVIGVVVSILLILTGVLFSIFYVEKFMAIVICSFTFGIISLTFCGIGLIVLLASDDFCSRIAYREWLEERELQRLERYNKVLKIKGDKHEKIRFRN